ncbi:acyl-CoA dehydrogenase, partial [Micrococcus luteus]|nr:acyl-CoA dehydrogenase [Micrococcus luteus]
DGHWDRAEYPLDLVARAGELDLLTDGLEVPGHPVMSPLAAGLVAMEISRADGSMAAAAAVQGGLVLRALVHCAGPEQKERYLETSARPDGAGGWVLNGAKKWIGNGAAGGITIVWARDTEDGQVKGFVVEQSTPGYEAEVITGKGALRAIHQAEITLTDVRVGDDARLPDVATFKDAARVLVA